MKSLNATAARNRYAVLVEWSAKHYPPSYTEVLDGLPTVGEAEIVAREARRLGAESASVHTTRQAYRLAEPQLARQRQQDQQEQTENTTTV